MALRVLTAVIALLVVVPILFLGGVPGLQALCVVAAWLGLWEYGGLRTPPASPGNRAFAATLASLPILASGYGWIHAEPRSADLVLLALGISFLAIPIQAVLRPKDLETAPARISATLFGVVYLGLTLGFAVMLRALPNGLLWILLTLAAVWLGDTGAYVVGKAIGKHKLHPRVSPGKTWEGAIAGLLTSIAAGIAAWAIFGWLAKLPPPRTDWVWAGDAGWSGWWRWKGDFLPLGHAIAAAAVVGLLGQVGDLAESLLKRAANVKDSGTMFPGHGGMLDRIDALLFALPGVYFYAKFVF